MRRRLLIGLSILAVCAFAGGAYAATSATSPKQAFLNDVAGRLHVSPQRLKSAVQGALQDRLNAAVKAGRLTQAQANRIEKRLREGRIAPLAFLGPALLGAGPLLPVGPGQLPLHPGLWPRARGFMFRVPAFGGGLLATAARYLGVTPVQLFKQLGSGKSLAQVAGANGKSVAGLESAIVAAERTRLDEARKAGLITGAQEHACSATCRRRSARW
jgi:hypothetical protein